MSANALSKERAFAFVLGAALPEFDRQKKKPKAAAEHHVFSIWVRPVQKVRLFSFVQAKHPEGAIHCD